MAENGTEYRYMRVFTAGGEWAVYRYKAGSTKLSDWQVVETAKSRKDLAA